MDDDDTHVLDLPASLFNDEIEISEEEAKAAVTKEVLATVNNSDLFHGLLKRGFFDLAEELLRNDDIDAHAKNSWNVYLMHLVAEYGNVSLAQILVEKGAPIDSGHADCTRPFLEAISYGRLDVMKVLMDNGVRSSCDNRGKRLLHFIDYNGPDSLKALHFVLDNHLEDANIVDRYGMTGLMTAVYSATVHQPSVDYLIQHSDVNMRDTMAFENCIGWAIPNGTIQTLGKLIAAGADVDFDSTLQFCFSPLLKAWSYLDLETFQFLLFEGLAQPRLLFDKNMQEYPAVAEVIDFDEDCPLQFAMYALLFDHFDL